jgi:hypothetical protein
MPSIPLMMTDPLTVETEADPYNFDERVEAAFDLGRKDTFLERHWMEEGLDEIESKDPIGKLDPEELNRRFPHVEVPFDKPTSFLVANELNERAKEKQKLMRIITNEGKDDGTAISLLGGIAAHAIDPVEAGADILLTLGTAGIGAVLTKSAQAGKFGAKSQAVLKATKRAAEMNQLSKNMIEGVAANAALEPFFVESSKTMQEKYEFTDMAISILGGGVAFPAAAYGTAKAFRGIGNNYKWAGQAAKAVMSQIAHGNKPDLSIIGKIRDQHFSAKTQAAPDTIRGKYKYMDLSPDEILDRPFYLVNNSQGALDLGDHRVPYGATYMGDDGIHITDSPIEAERMALDPMDTTGEIKSLNLKTKNLLDSDQTPSQFPSVRGTLLDPEMQKVFDQAPTLTQAFKDVTDFAELNGQEAHGILGSMHNAIKELGYDGVVYKEADTANHAFIYSGDRVERSTQIEGKTKSEDIQEYFSEPKLQGGTVLWKDDKKGVGVAIVYWPDNTPIEVFFDRSVTKNFDQLSRHDRLKMVMKYDKNQGGYFGKEVEPRDALISENETITPSSKESPRHNSDEIRAAKDTEINDPKRSLFYNDQTQREIDEFKGIDEFNVRQNEVEVNRVKQDLQDLVDNGLATKEDENVLKFLNDEERLSEADDATYKKILNCILRFGK